MNGTASARLIAGGVVLLLGLPVGAGPVNAAENPIEQAGRAAQRTTFTAHVDVRWVDAAGEHTVGVDVVSGSGYVTVAGPSPSQVWPGTLAAPATPLADKYEITSQPGGYVAGRRTTAVEVREGGQLVERLALDMETGIILRRETYGAAGRVVRSVEVEQLQLSAPKAKPVAPPALRTMAGPPAPFPAPTALAGGYQRTGAYRRGHAVQLVYSDGLHSLSVFAQPGTLRTSKLPNGGMPVSVGRQQGIHYRWPGGDVVMWDAKGVVYTTVGDAPVDDVVAASASMPSARSLSFGGRLRHACRALVETLAGGL
ncbi:MAG TPA: sigma-E factor regulatory protein RseB domain-containing protein [Acidimicrobiales bacterium]|nr:sigma-E factor regulatory protein RseB domain-containing protein [Acidimicrobiales bacterium]